MSAPEHAQAEQRSSVKVTLNAKHEPQFEFKLVDGADEDDIVRLRALAVEQFHALKRELGVGS